MDKLKNFIDTNREAFEDDSVTRRPLRTPLSRSWLFPRKSRATLYKPLRFCRGSLHRPAVPLQTAGWHAFAYSAKAGGHRPCAMPCEVKEEIEELRLYYNMQMSDIISQMQAMYKLQQTPGAEELFRKRHLNAS
ncbi:MAG: hypothetical protein ACLRS8_04370 [Parabacteroides merdae]